MSYSIKVLLSDPQTRYAATPAEIATKRVFFMEKGRSVETNSEGRALSVSSCPNIKDRDKEASRVRSVGGSCKESGLRGLTWTSWVAQSSKERESIYKFFERPLVDPGKGH